MASAGGEPGIVVTEVRVKLADDSRDKLLGFCSITLNDCVVVKDIKIIQGDEAPFIAMPSRKITDKCGGCGGRNHLRARYCNDCGSKLRPERAAADDRGRPKLHFDLVHPVNGEVRATIHQAIIQAYKAEAVRTQAVPAKP